MTLQEVMTELETYGNEQTKKTLLKHGAQEPFFGVKVGDLKKIIKKTKKKNHELSLELYNTGNSDAMYLAGLIADETKITKEQLQDWVKKAYWYYLSEFAVAFIAAESPYGLELAQEWIESDEENIASSGWATLASYISRTDDNDLDIAYYSKMLDRVKAEVHMERNRVRYTMNGFVIAVGAYITDLTNKAKDIGQDIGKVSVDMGGTACKVPEIKPYLEKMEKGGRIGKKRKVARC